MFCEQATTKVLKLRYTPSRMRFHAYIIRHTEVGEDKDRAEDPIGDYLYESSGYEKLTDYDLELAYQKLRDSCSLYFDTAYDFRDYLVSQESSTAPSSRSIIEGMSGEDVKDPVQLVKEYCRRMPKKCKPSSADSFNSATHSHHSGQFSGYNSDRESPPRVVDHPESIGAEDLYNHPRNRPKVLSPDISLGNSPSSNDSFGRRASSSTSRPPVPNFDWEGAASTSPASRSLLPSNSLITMYPLEQTIEAYPALLRKHASENETFLQTGSKPFLSSSPESGASGMAGMTGLNTASPVTSCIVCGQLFSCIEHVRQHVPRCDRGCYIKPPYKCVFCKDQFSVFFDLWLHFQECSLQFFRHKATSSTVPTS